MKLISSRLLGGVALCLLTLSSGFMVTGCTKQQKLNVAEQIVNWQPAADSAVQTTLTILEGLTPDPAAQAVEAVIQKSLQGAGTIVRNAAQSYIDNPTNSNLQALQQIVVSVQQTINAQILQAAQISNPASQKSVLQAINGVGTIFNTILSLVQSISSQAQLKAMSEASPIKFAQVRALMDTAAMDRAGARYGVNAELFFDKEAAAGF